MFEPHVNSIAGFFIILLVASILVAHFWKDEDRPNFSSWRILLTLWVASGLVSMLDKENFFFVFVGQVAYLFFVVLFIAFTAKSHQKILEEATFDKEVD